MRVDVYVCDRCGGKAKPEGVPKFPQDWVRLTVEQIWAKDADRWVKRDLCNVCHERIMLLIDKPKP